jgi:SAM-dependent methyltransferase
LASVPSSGLAILATADLRLERARACVRQDDRVEDRARRVVGAGYDAIGGRYRDWSSGSAVRLGFVDQLLRRLSAGSTVVDLGCGPGEPATRLLSARHRVLGVDLSDVQLRLARQAAPSAALVRADMTELALREGSVDAAASFYALGHLPPAAHAPLLRSIASWLRPGGLLLTSAPLNAGGSVEPDWLGVPMYFGGIGEQATIAAVEAAGLVLDDTQVVAEDEGDGHLVRFLWLTAHRPIPTR